jgi:membrane dipeptidase
MIFDAHGDIWTDVTVKRQAGMDDVFKNYHMDKYKMGGVNGGIFVIWIDPPNDEHPQKRLLEIIENMSIEITNNSEIFEIIRTIDDLKKAIKSNKFATIIGLEGLDYIGNNINILNILYMLGARHASLTWNNSNELATGVKGNPKRGLTKYGVEAIRRMEKLGMIVDVSHANDRTFWDICDNVTKPFIASHSNCRTLCNSPRNLTDFQLKAIKDIGGVVGINSFANFIDEDPKNRDVEHLVNHIDYMVDVIGVQHVGLGFDFSGYLSGETLSSFAGEDSITIGLENIAKVPKLIKILENRGYSKEDIESISYKNFLRIIEEILN